LKPGGRLLFPWRPADDIGLAVLVTRREQGFALAPITPAWFIPCVGASSMETSVKKPTHASAWSVGSLWPIAERKPDDTAVAIYENVWFSSTVVEGSSH
jgi:protein-L-isoaspartate(D-aspartate) O-methyltransferase